MVPEMWSVVERAFEHSAATTLISCWVAGHALIFISLIGKKLAKPNLIIIGVLFLLLYLFKPSTYDFHQYSVYFDYSSIPTVGFFLDESGKPNLAPTDVEGPFCPYGTQGFASLGFCTLIAITREYLPQGPWLVPRVGYGTQYISDSLFLVVMMLGLGSVLSAMILWRDGILDRESWFERLFYALPLTLGSVFFLVGSQIT